MHTPGAKGGRYVDLDLIAYARADKVSRTDAFYAVRSGDADEAESISAVKAATAASTASRLTAIQYSWWWMAPAR